MKQTLRKMQNKRAGGDSGFTLIELLVVVVIIGVLVAIAIPMYMNYRKGAANKSAQADVRSAINAVEQFYTENGNVYPEDNTTGTTSANMVLTKTGLTGVVNQTATVSPGNGVTFKTIDSGTAYFICGWSSDGGSVYVYNNKDGAVKKTSHATLAACVTANGAAS